MEATSMEDSNQAAKASADLSSISPTPERRSSGDDDSAAMTIEFLRARLLSERSVSKAARERAQQLAKKVTELEKRLEAEIEIRQKLEADRLEILVKCRAELGDHYGEYSPLNLGEGFSRDESALDSPFCRNHDTHEKVVSDAADEGKDCLLHNLLKHTDRSVSSPQLSLDEPDDEVDETDHSEREKGVLSWGRRKGLRKEFVHGNDWIGRSFSPRSQGSTGSESSHKKWAGKSVRQIRRMGTRPFDANEGENELNQSSEEIKSQVGQQTGMEDPCPRDDERDTEVERVLEQQAELIEQYEDEEIAQRAWEAKYTEGKVLSSYETVEVIVPSDLGEMLDATIRTQSQGQDLMAAGVDAQAVETESIQPMYPSNDSATKHFSKVHPEETQKRGDRVLPCQLATQYTPQNMDKHPLFSNSNAPHSHVDQTGLYMSNLENSTPEKSVECSEICEEEDISHGLINDSSHGLPSSANVDVDLSSDLAKEPAIEAARKSKFTRRLSSSFKFAVLPDAELVSGTSPHMHGFTINRQSDQHDEDKSQKLVELNRFEDASAFSGPHNSFADDHVISMSIVDNHAVEGDASPVVDGPNPTRIENMESEVKEKLIVQENVLTRENQMFVSSVKYDGTVSSQIIDPPNTDFKQGETRQDKGLEAEQDVVGPNRYSSQSPYMESKAPCSGEYFQQQSHADQPHMDHDFRLSRGQDEADYETNYLYSGTNLNPGYHFRQMQTLPLEERALGSHRRSLDCVDRVADVLMVLEMAKLQVQSSNEQDLGSSSSDRIDSDGRDLFYRESPMLSSAYANASQPYSLAGTYSSRGPSYFHNLNGLSALSPGHAVASSRQVTNGMYSHYPSQIPEIPPMWAPPPPNVYNNVYHYDVRQHR